MLGQQGSYRVFWVGHGVKGTEFHRELVDDEIISVIFRFDEASKSLLVLRTKLIL